MSPKLWIVKWHDAHGMKGEDARDEVMRSHKPATYYSAGILVQSDLAGVTIAQDYGLPLNDGDEFTYRTRTFIPRELVVNEFPAGNLMRVVRKQKVRLDDTKQSLTLVGAELP